MSRAAQGAAARAAGTSLDRVTAGDRAALASRYHRDAGTVLAHLVPVTGDLGLGEDILQDTMLAVWRRAGTYQGISPLAVLPR